MDTIRYCHVLQQPWSCFGKGDFLKEKWRSVLQSGLVHLDSASGRGGVLLYRENSFKPASKAFRGYCDGCLLDIYGLRFQCQTCDHCVMYKLGSEAAHPGHEWKCFDPDAKSNDHDDSGSKLDDENNTTEVES